MAKVTMPQLGESVAEGTIGKWLKQPGDHVAKYEPLVEVVTDKVNAEVPSPFEGILRSAHTEIRLEPADAETEGTVVSEQRLKGLSRLGGFMMRRGTGRTLNEALAGLERVTGDAGATEATT